MRRLILWTLLVGLLPFAAGYWYLRTSPVPAPPDPFPDHALAARIGILPSDLPGWASSRVPAAGVFAAGATTGGPSAARTAEQASSILARCLRVSVPTLDDAFDMGTAAGQRTAQVASPSYVDPQSNGGSVTSMVDIERSSTQQEADAQVFANPSLFATCYQPFVQAMLPYSDTAGTTGGFATATVQPAVVPVPTSTTSVQVAAFQIARLGGTDGQEVTSVTTAVAVFGGRVQVYLASVSNFVFPLDTQDALVRSIETRVIGADLF